MDFICYEHAKSHKCQVANRYTTGNSTNTKKLSHVDKINVNMATPYLSNNKETIKYNTYWQEWR